MRIPQVLALALYICWLALPVQAQTSCGTANDSLTHIPSDYLTLTPGAVGTSYTDVSYGCKVTRITDGKSYCNSASQHLYAFPTPINLDDTMVIDQLQPPGCGPNAPRYIVSNQGVVVVPAANFPSTASTPDISWDQDDPLTFYYTSGLALYKGVVNKAAGTVESTSICDFTGTYTTLGIPDEENISYDNDHFWLVGNGNLSTGQAVFVTLTPASPSPHTGCIKGATVNIGAQTSQAIPGWHKIQISPLNELMNLNTGTQKTDIWKTDGTLLRTDTNTSHFDVGYDSDGTTEVMIGHMYAGTSTNLCASRNGFAVERISDGTVLRCLLDDGGHESASHVSYRDTRSATPWVLMSMERTIPGCSSTDETGTDMSCIGGNSNWYPYSGEEIVCKIDASVCMRLLHHYSRSSVDAYWATPRGAISIDGTSLVFDSNYNNFNSGATTSSGWKYVDTYMTTFISSGSAPAPPPTGNAPAPPTNLTGQAH